MAKKKFLFSWPKFWTNELVSATIEDAAKADVVLTFKSIKPFTKSIASEFTIAGKMVSGIAKSTANKTITITVTVDFIKQDTPSVVFNTLRKGANVTQVITNNIT